MHISELAQPLSGEQIDQIIPVFTSAFGHPPATDFVDRLNEKRKLSILVAGDGSIEGFKIGYERYRNVFFSWLGAVKAERQRRGVARALLQHQHRLCFARGYHEIQTETFGDGNGMLLLNLQEGFEVFGTQLGSDNRLRVQLRKMLLSSNCESGAAPNGGAAAPDNFNAPGEPPSAG